MKDKKNIILLAGLFFAGTAYVAASDCPCEGGTAPYQYDCDGDGVPDSCEPCGSCEENGIPSDPSRDCCGGDEYDTASECCEDAVVLQGECPEITGLVATDSSAGTRSSSGSLQMVLADGARSAAIQVSTSGAMLPGYPKWSGGGVSGADGASSATYSGTSGGAVTVSVSSSKSETVNISLVSQNQKSVNLLASGGAIGQLASRSQSLTNFLSGGSGSSMAFGGSITGMTKNVDYYGDGERIGDYLSLAGEFSANLVPFSFSGPHLPIGGTAVTVVARVEFSAGTAKLMLDAAYDESKSNPWVNLSGGFSFNQGASFGAAVVLGRVCYAEYLANLEVSVGGNVSHSGKTINLNTGGAVGPVTGTFRVFVEAFGWECTLYTREHKVYGELYSFSGPSIVIYEIK